MPSQAPTGRESDKFNLRMPDGMRDRIAAAARASGRSMNSEIVARLEESLAAGDIVRTMPSDVKEFARQLVEELERKGADLSKALIIMPTDQSE